MREWDFSSSQHAHSSVNNVEENLAKGNKRLDGKNKPAKSSCRPEIDTTYELAPEQPSHFQLLIGMLIWISEL